MRKFLILLLLVATLGGVGACAKFNTAASTMTASDAVSQARGTAMAVATLTETSPLDANAKAQVANWNAWLQFALQAAGIVTKAIGI